MAGDPAWASRLLAFLDGWRGASAAESLPARLSRFVDSVHSLLPRTTDVQEAVAVDADRLAKFLSHVGGSLRTARTAGATINPWTVARLGTNEVRNAAVLTALWSPHQTGDTAIRFFAAFLGGIDGLGALLPSEEELRRGYRVSAEHSPDGAASERVDLVIETADRIIGVEIKIEAREGPQQLERYVAAIERLASLRSKLGAVILLAPFPPTQANVLSASWANVRAAVAATLPERRSAYTFTDHLLADFARHITRF